MLLGMLGFIGCNQPTEVIALRCDVTITDIQPQPSAVGESAQLFGGPFTSVYDSAVYVGESRATVLEVDRSSCIECDVCRARSGCTECSDCDVCDRLCATTCTESVLFEVPDVSAGDYGLQLFNAHGQSKVMSFAVESSGFEATDTSAGDSGDADTADSGS
ncbi:MAG: hypothetical protein CL927_17810 [Deltaproteobacteria bacterium]|nr:hypothetical protein [Deltaproteobacteria bacterium]HCH63265.1 hypothetical protein [Deltaproteobacteria bacterium]